MKQNIGSISSFSWREKSDSLLWFPLSPAPCSCCGKRRQAAPLSSASWNCAPAEDKFKNNLHNWCCEETQKGLSGGSSVLLPPFQIHLTVGVCAAALPDNCGRHPSSWSDQAEPSDPRCQTAERAKTSETSSLFNMRAGAVLYLHVDAVLKPALGLRLHQPVSVLRSTGTLWALLFLSTGSWSFPLLPSWGRRLAVAAFTCGFGGAL